MKSKCMTLCFFVISFILFGCQSTPNSVEVVVAEQFGLSYAPIEVMKVKGYFKEELLKQGYETVNITWKTMGNTSAIREAMVAGELDFGCVAIPPFLIGKDNGMDWKIVSGISESPLALISNDASIKRIEDILDEHKIIVPQPGSIQHILLSMYSLRNFGDAKRFDQQLLGMSHPDGMTVMLSSDLPQLHFTAPPYMDKELAQEGFQKIIDGETCFGGRFTFITAVCPSRVYEDEKKYTAFKNALERAILDINGDRESVIELLSESYEYTSKELTEYLSHPQMVFSQEVLGLETFMSFMKETDLIKNQYLTDDLIWKSYEE